jgi:hypothetical protein
MALLLVVGGDRSAGCDRRRTETGTSGGGTDGGTDEDAVGAAVLRAALYVNARRAGTGEYQLRGAENITGIRMNFGRPATS